MVAGGGPQFLSREGNILQSPEEALTFLAANTPPYQDVDLERVESFTSQVMAGLEEECEEESQPEPSPPERAEAGESSQYGADRSVPPGWRLRLDGARGLLSPGGVSYRSRR